MSLITYEGTVEQGQVKLLEDIRLPEKATVYIIILDPSTEQGFAQRTKPDLDEMVAHMPADYQVQEENFGSPVGNEAW